VSRPSIIPPSWKVIPPSLMGHGCNVLMGTCPPDLLDCVHFEPSCAATDPGVDTCCSGYAVLTTTGRCGCACLNGDFALYRTLDACRAACGG